MGWRIFKAYVQDVGKFPKGGVWKGIHIEAPADECFLRYAQGAGCTRRRRREKRGPGKFLPWMCVIAFRYFVPQQTRTGTHAYTYHRPKSGSKRRGKIQHHSLIHTLYCTERERKSLGKKLRHCSKGGRDSGQSRNGSSFVPFSILQQPSNFPPRVCVYVKGAPTLSLTHILLG